MFKAFPLFIALALIAPTAQAAQPIVRKALVTCEFKSGIGADGKVAGFEDGKLSYKIDLDSKEVEVNCVGQEICLLDGGPQIHALIKRVAKDASFAPIVQDGPYASYSSNMPELLIEGGNGDDMELFTRITFFPKGPKSLVATAVLIYADEGNDGMVSAPTDCTVDLLR